MSMTKSRSNFIGLIAVLFLSIALSFLLLGGAVLNPSNIAWLQFGDMAQSYLGWSFFSNSPWAIPLGSNPDFGLQLSSSIVYSDSIPILAIFFKLFNSILPTPFQYFGAWMYACIIFQGLLSWFLLGEICEDPLCRYIGTIFFIASPVLLFRAGMHLALILSMVSSTCRIRRGSFLYIFYCSNFRSCKIS